MTQANQSHHDTIIDQFSRQAIPFTQLPGHLDAIEMLVAMSNVTNKDHVLDVACGPGLVACEFAKTAQHVTGIDLTQAMIDQARLHQQELGLTNLSWQVGTALPLPYADHSFSIVVTRYSFHHFLDPQAALHEMIRVCQPGGRIVIADAAPPKENVDAYNQLEKLRDPSHTRALALEEWQQLFGQSGLKDLKRGHYTVEMELEKQLQASFPNLGDKEKIRVLFRDDVGKNQLGMNTRQVGNEIHFSYPIAIFAGQKDYGENAIPPTLSTTNKQSTP
ncbi:methyltransferase domain-containing protein [uncultured Desulfuromonas sp.]|uniref:class I SAM-dependent methyltransferase n=1 Tax=uncultured Desulfuromonas sp. TaxID=181013 RepID=UPI002AAB4C12|nr:methyltransferase domain-containing protein [uncultured Desulfuromonas sp.]